MGRGHTHINTRQSFNILDIVLVINRVPWGPGGREGMGGGQIGKGTHTSTRQSPNMLDIVLVNWVFACQFRCVTEHVQVNNRTS